MLLHKHSEELISHATVGGAVSYGPWEPESKQNMGFGQTDLGSNPSSLPLFCKVQAA